MGAKGRRLDGKLLGVTLIVIACATSACFPMPPALKQQLTATGLVPSREAPTQVASITRAYVPPSPSTSTRRVIEVKIAPEQRAALPLPFDLDRPSVDQRVERFLTSDRRTLDQGMLRGARYLPSMMAILEREGLPRELAYVPLIESGYRENAVSRAGATGPWQFLLATGRQYGLRIDHLVDERRDPIIATHAAVGYLKNLHALFGNWELSLAAYNSGEGRVMRLLKETDAIDFWSMRAHLPRETREYVPKILAAVKIASSPEAHGFLPPVPTRVDYEVVRVNRDVSLRTAAKLCGVTASVLEDLNPALRRGVSPTGYSLRVPAGKAAPLHMGGLASVQGIARAHHRVSRGERSRVSQSRVTRAARAR